MLVKEQSRLDVRKYSFHHIAIIVRNTLSTDCVHAVQEQNLQFSRTGRFFLNFLITILNIYDFIVTKS